LIAAAARSPGAAAGWSLLYGNFAIGCGVMATAGTLNDLARDLKVGVAVAGQLTSVGAVTMALGAPLLAAWVAGFDRRRLLTATLAWYAVGHALSAVIPGFGALLVVRALTVLGAALFTAQAAAAISAIAPPAERGRAITFVFLGWSVASVLGLPLSAAVGETLGWRWAFALVALAAAVGAAAVWRALPDGVRPPALSRADWRHVLTHPALMATVGVTALSSAGQFTLFAYFAPYYREVLGVGAAQLSTLFFWFGALGVIGNVLLSRHIDRLGVARAVSVLLGAIALSLALWPLGTSVVSMALVSAPWALGCFASNSAQQARLGLAAPALASALIALNSSAMYVGQALGAGGGGLIVAQSGYGALHWVGLAWLLLAIGLSLWAASRMSAPLRAVGRG
jgi:predicted MFS family arabinose efflux permease